MTVQHLMAAVPKDRDHRHRRQEIDEWHEAGAQPGGGERAVQDRVGFGLQATNLLLLGAESLHDADAGETLLDDARNVCEFLLQREVHRRDPMRKPRGRDVEERQRAQCEDGEDHVLGQHDDEHAAHREQTRDRQRDEDDDGLHLLNIGVRPRHELTGLRLVMEREVQALEVREQPVAKIGLGPQCDTKRGVAAQPSADRLHDANRHHDEGQADDLALIAVAHAVVDRGGGQQRNRQLGRGPKHSGANSTKNP